MRYELSVNNDLEWDICEEGGGDTVLLVGRSRTKAMFYCAVLNLVGLS